MSASQIVAVVLACLHDRSGFDGWWDFLDSDIQEEIIEDLTVAVEDAL